MKLRLFKLFYAQNGKFFRKKNKSSKYFEKLQVFVKAKGEGKIKKKLLISAQGHDEV